MKGDFSRLTFNPTRHYSGVRMQQGRVQLDADWNEQMDILLHHFETEVNDFIGRSGVPADYNGGTSFQVTSTTDGDLLVAPGRYYIAGRLFQNDAAVRLPKEQLPTDPGQYVAYLDAWQGHVTPLEDPTLREVALGGADTATRIQNVWQVCFQKTDARPDLDWQPAGGFPLSTGSMRARVAVGGATLENQLYRVEIYQGGAPGVATCKWSRENGSIAATITNITGKTVNMSSAGRDPQSSFAARQWVELSTVTQAQRSDPGFLVQLDAVQGTELTLAEPPSDETPFTIVRRWDSAGALPLRPTNTDGDGWILLENDIQVQFDLQADRVYNAGDYWLFPARTIPGDIEWPRDSAGTPLPQPPHGVRHDYVALAFLQLKDGTWSLVDAESDLRVQFPALDKGFVSKEGDTIRGSLHVGGAGDPSKALTVNGATALNGDLTVVRDKPTTLGGTLTVTGTTDLGGNTRIGTDQQAGNLDVKGTLSIGGTMAADATPLTIVKSATDFAHVRFAQNGTGQLEIVGWSGGWNINAKTDGKHLYLNRDASATSNVLIGRQGRELLIRGNDGNIGIGTANPVARLDIAQTARTGNGHPTAAKGLYVTGDFGEASDGVEFRDTNGTQGIGLGRNTIYATGSKADQPLNLQPRGKGEIGMGGDMRLNNHALLLRDTGDSYHGLAWFGENQQFASTAPNGPVVFGYGGGGLGVRRGQANGTLYEQLALQWSGSGDVTANGSLSVAQSIAVGPYAIPNAQGRFCVTGSEAEIGFAKRSLTTWPEPAQVQAGDRFLWYNPDGIARLWTEVRGDLVTVTSDGKIGIGPTAPSAKLTVDPQGAGGILIGNPNASSGGYTGLHLRISAEKDGQAEIQAVKSSGTAWGDLVLNPNGGNVVLGSGARPIVIKRFTNISDDPTYNTGYSTSDWMAAIVGFWAETTNSTSTRSMGVYMMEQSGTWYIRADVLGPTERWDVIDVMFIKRNWTEN